MRYRVACVVVAWVVLLGVGPAADAVTASPGQYASDPAVINSHLNAFALPPVLVSSVAQQTARHLPWAWHAMPSRNGARLANSVQHLDLHVGPVDTTVTIVGSDALALQLIGCRQGTQNIALAPSAPPQIDGTRIALTRGTSLTEWYINSPLGIEQGFTLAHPARPAATAILSFKLRSALHVVLTHNTLTFQNAAGKTVLHYGSLYAYDADHRVLPARMTLVGDRLALIVDTLGARYPVTVDPLFSTTQTLADPGGQVNDNFGAVALSADGKTAVIGAGGGSGHAYIYTQAQGNWSASPVVTLNDPGSSSYDHFGGDVALSADGRTALIGAWGGSVGVVYVYQSTGGTWSTTPVARLVDPSNQWADGFGLALALSANGSVALIGAAGTTNVAGLAYVYVSTNGTWSSTPVAVFYGTDNSFTNQFGEAVALSGDGSTALIGAGGTNSGTINASGAAYIFKQVSGQWSRTPALRFDDPNPSPYDLFGSTVAISADGSTALIGAEGASGYLGKAYIYSNSSGTWGASPEAVFNAPSGAGTAQFGSSVALSSNGGKAFIGATGTMIGNAAGAGAAYIFTCTGGIWSGQPVLALDDPKGLAYDAFGSGIAVSADGASTMLVGAINTTVNGATDAGMAYILAPSADLSLTMSGSPADITIGQNVAFNFSVSNTDSQVTATDVTLTDTLPAGMSFVSAAAAGGSCSHSGGSVTCTIASLAPQGLWQPALMVTTTTAGSLQNTSLVSANQPDPNTANNSASVTTTVTVAPPVANNGSITTAQNTAINGTLSASDPQNLSLTYSISSQPGHGTVTLTNASSGAFTYTPTSGYSGTDSFAFVASNGSANSNTATETITITAPLPAAPASGGGGTLGMPSLLLLGMVAVMESHRRKGRTV